MPQRWSHAKGSCGGGDNWQGSGQSSGRKPRAKCGGRFKGKHYSSRKARSSKVVASSANPQVAASAARTQVAESAAGAVDDFQQEYDKANMQDMTLEERQDACRSLALGKAFQNWRRSILKALSEMQFLKSFFMAWRNQVNLLKGKEGDLCLEDLLLTENDMDHFLHTVSSFETHKEMWRKTRRARQDPTHKDHGKLMPVMIPPSYVRLFQITLSQTYSKKFRQYFGAADIDGTLHTPFQMLAMKEDASLEDDKVAGSAALSTKFQVRLFKEDTRLAIDYETAFLDRRKARHLVWQVKRYRGTKLWMFVMKQVKQLATRHLGPMKEPSPFLLRAGFEQKMGAAFKKRWQHAQDHEQEEEPRLERQQAQDHEASLRSRETPNAKRPRVDLTPWYSIKKRKTVVLKKRKQLEGKESEEEPLQKKHKKKDQQDQLTPTLRSDEEDKDKDLKSQSEGDSKSQSEGDSKSQMDNDSKSQTVSDSKSKSETESAQSEAESASQSQSEDDIESKSQSETPEADYPSYHSPTDITKTENAELDEALDDLKPPKVAESAAPCYFHDFTVDERIHSQIDEAAHSAYDSISKFRKEVIHPLMDDCVCWIHENMKDFGMLAVEVFGSKCYLLELCSSDIDIVVVLGPGLNVKSWLDQLRIRTDADPAFGKRFQRHDTLQTMYMGVPVDIKAVKHNRTSDAACRSTDSLKSLITQRMIQQKDFELVKLRAILIFKLLLHHLKVVQHHWKGLDANFKAISLSFWAVLCLDMTTGCKSVGDYLVGLCHNFVNFEWQRLKVAVSAAGAFSITETEEDLTAAVRIMLDDGMVNSSQNVTVAHLKFAQNAIQKALPNLHLVIDQALAYQDIASKRLALAKKLSEVKVEIQHAKVAHEPAAKKRPKAAKKAGSAAEMAGSAAKVAESAAKVAESAATVAESAVPASSERSPQSPPRETGILTPGDFKFGDATGVIVAPPEGTDHDSAPIILLVPPGGGFRRKKTGKKKKKGKKMEIPLNCPKPCWYAYMQWSVGTYNLKLPPEFLDFVKFVNSRAKSRAIIGWGLSRGAKWLIELAREHAGLLTGAVMIAGYPQTKDKDDQELSAKELIAIRNCVICMLHFVSDECCGVTCFPHWHAEFERHMAVQVAESAAEVAGSAANSSSKPPPPPKSSLLSLNLPGSHSAGYPIWLHWQVDCHRVFNQWWEMLWKMVKDHVR